MSNFTNTIALRDRLKEDRNPGHNIGTWLLEHSNNPEYLISHLESYLEAIKADLEVERRFFAKLSGSDYKPKRKVVGYYLVSNHPNAFHYGVFPPDMSLCADADEVKRLAQATINEWAETAEGDEEEPYLGCLTVYEDGTFDMEDIHIEPEEKQDEDDGSYDEVDDVVAYATSKGVDVEKLATAFPVDRGSFGNPPTLEEFVVYLMDDDDELTAEHMKKEIDKLA